MPQACFAFVRRYPVTEKYRPIATVNSQSGFVNKSIRNATGGSLRKEAMRTPIIARNAMKIHPMSAVSQRTERVSM
jgi:hypothetical protein